MNFCNYLHLIVKIVKNKNMKINLVKLIAGMLFLTTSLHAQMPTLSVNGKKESAEVYLSSLDIRVEVSGNIATTKYVMVFKNRTSKVLEGELLFPLPDGVTVSHYALDINGKMREAVPVEKAKATQVFEEIEQRRVDPGLLERVEGNNFRTRIYPIPSNGTRTISIGYEEELTVENESLHYRLPMDYKEAIENFSLKATVWQSKTKPVVANNSTNELTFDKQGNSFVSTFSRKNYKTSRLLAFSLPAPTDIPQVVMQSASGCYYFVASCLPKIEKRKKEWSSQLGIIWDASLSGLSRDVKRELELLDVIIQDKKNLSISLYLLNNNFTEAGTFNIKNGNWTELRKALESVEYDGGTSYNSIKLLGSASNEFLFFSDGISTLSDVIPVVKLSMFSRTAEMMLVQQIYADKMVHCVVSSPKADYSNLKLIAAHTSGKFINLNALSPAKEKEEVLYETLSFLGIENVNRTREMYPSVSTSVNGSFSIAGISDAQQASFTLLFGYGKKVSQRINVNLDAKNAVEQGSAHRIWAQKKINELDLNYEKNKDDLTELGQQFGIVTRNTSLIVLETLQDYITYNIVPPAELQSEFFAWRKGQETNRQQMEKNFLAQAISAAEILKKWWDTDFTPKKPKYPVPDNKKSIIENRTIIVEDEMLLDSDSRVMEVPVMDAMAVQEEAEADVAFMMVERSTTAESKVKEEAAPRAAKPQATIKLMKIKQDSEYMKSLKGKSDEDYKTYLQLRKDYINSPNFYFDMSDWFYKLGDKEKALRILTSIADIDIENASLFRLLGYRLKEYKEYKLQVFICKKVIQWRPMEPQSYRDYALALADAGQNQEAIKSLYSVITQKYSQNINNRSVGIEEVIVTELNRMIAKNPKLSTSEIDTKLIKAMPVDIRVVINWNMNSTDIDLHVKDPNNETCFFSHKSTEIGGRISSDITQGYGPEQFLLKNAIKGKYEVFVNYYGDSQVKAEGPSTIMLEVYTRYSDKEEQRQVMCVQMSKDNKNVKNGLLKVAEFEF